jgi:hypothetical protein
MHDEFRAAVELGCSGCFNSIAVGSVADVSAPRPRWYTPRSARRGFVLGIFWIVLGVADLVWAPHVPGLLAVAAVWLAVGTGNLVAAVVLRRRERSHSAADSPGQSGPPPSTS